MARIGKEMVRLFSSLPTDEKTLIARRAAEVRTMWKDAIEYVYKENAPYVLDHVNCLYKRRRRNPLAVCVYGRWKLSFGCPLPAASDYASSP